MKRKIIIVAVSILVVAGIIAAGALSRPSFDPDRAIPADAVAVFYTKNNAALLEAAVAENPVWEGLCFSAMEHSVLAYLLRLDSLLRENQHDVKYLSGKKSYLSLHSRKNDSLAALLTMEMKSGNEKRNVDRIFKHIAKLERIKPAYRYEKSDFYAFQTPSGSLFYTLQGNVFLASNDQALLQEAVDNLRQEERKTLWDNETFKNASNSWGQWVDGNVYLFYPKLKPPAGSEQRKRYAALLQNADQFALWSSADVSMKENFWTFSGYTAAQEKSLLSIFENQQTAASDAASLLPDNTEYFLSFGYSNAALLLKNIQEYSSEYQEDYKGNLKEYNNKFKINLHADFSKFMGNTICFAWIKNSPVLCVKIRSEKQAADFMRKVSVKKESRFENAAFVDMLIGKNIYNMKSNYWTIQGSYLLIAENSGVFNEIANKKRSLKSAPQFKAVSESLSEKSNITFYASGRGMEKLFNEYQGGKNEDLNAFNGIALQFSAEDGLFYTHGILEANRSYQFPKIGDAPPMKLLKIEKSPKPEVKEKNEEELVVPKSENDEESTSSAVEPEATLDVDLLSSEPEQASGFILDGKMILSPSPVFNHRLQRVNFIVFDHLKNVYLVDKEDGILWKRKLPELPLGNAFEIDYYANGKIQYLFNSTHFIFGIDALGNDLKDFPIKLGEKAQNPIAVFDFQKNKNYAILFVDAKGNLQSLDKTGKTTANWSAPVVPEKTKISVPAQYIAKDGHHFIIVAADDGTAYFYNRQGKEALSINGAFRHNPGSDFFANRTNKKGVLLTTDEAGALVYIAASGAIQKTDFPAVSKAHYFLYEDFKGDGNHDFIFLDDKILKVYDRFQNVIMEYVFSQKPEKPIFFKSGAKNYLIVYLEKENAIYLLDKSGVLKTLPATTAPAVFKIKNNGKSVVATAKEKEIIFYEID